MLVNVLQPGAGMNVDPATLDTKSIASYTGPGKMTGTVDFILNIIPNTLVDAFAKGEILQVLLIAVLFGFALHRFGGRGTLVFDVIEKGSHVLFGIVNYIMKLAPIGAFGAMAFTIGKYGLGSLFSLGKLMGTFYLTCLLFIFVVLGLIARFHGFSIWKFIKYIKEELLIVLGTSSSESVLPRMMEKMENLGANKTCVGLVIPTGYSFNLDGTSIYLTMAAVFIAQATNTHMTLVQEITLLAVLLLTSKGAAGVTGSGFIVLAATLSAVGHVPVAGLALILGIDRFMSEAGREPPARRAQQRDLDRSAGTRGAGRGAQRKDGRIAGEHPQASPTPLQGATPAARQSRFRGVPQRILPALKVEHRSCKMERCPIAFPSSTRLPPAWGSRSCSAFLPPS